MDRYTELKSENDRLKKEIEELKKKNIDLKERLLYMESCVGIDYQEFIKGLNKLEALEAWFNEE